MRFPPYPKYRPSGIDWLGDVPENWTTKSLKWESPVKRGASPRPIDNQIYFDDEGQYAWVRIEDVSSAGMYLSSTSQRLSELGKSRSVPLEPGTLFLSIAGSVGKPCITAIKCCIHDGFVHFPRWRDDARFLYYVFASGEPYKGLGKLGTQLNLNTDTVGSIHIAFPPGREQESIADFLDRETEKIDLLIEKKRTLIERLNEKRTALISRTVTRGLPPDAARAAGLDPHPKLKPSGIDWLGEIPKHWELPPLYARYSVDLGKMLKEDRFTGSYPVPYLRNVDVQWDSINFEALPEMDISRGERSRYTIRPSDLLVCEGGEVGRCAIVGDISGSFAYQKALHRLRPRKKGEYPRFLFYTFVKLSWEGIFVAGGNPNTIPHLTGEKLKSYRLPTPPEYEQAEIVRFLNHETSMIDDMIQKIDEAIDRVLEYRVALITATVTGKIDIRGRVDPDAASPENETVVSEVART